MTGISAILLSANESTLTVNLAEAAVANGSEVICTEVLTRVDRTSVSLSISIIGKI